ncbi:hypothetical protein Bbelb_049520 [Branchiostoma belcheri]|nr:hypothetical protein Bbelb_049520 [Branchiostoma belcheri]
MKIKTAEGDERVVSLHRVISFLTSDLPSLTTGMHVSHLCNQKHLSPATCSARLTLIEILASMQQLCYADAEERSITSVFRMTNQIVLHHLLMKECLPGPPKTMTTRKLWGHYMHSLRDHIPIVFRIVATSSIMAENEERQFSSFKRITKSAIYPKPGHIITYLFVRTHYQQKLQPSSNNHQINKISQAAKTTPKERTRIPSTSSRSTQEMHRHTSSITPEGLYRADAQLLQFVGAFEAQLLQFVGAFEVLYAQSVCSTNLSIMPHQVSMLHQPSSSSYQPAQYTAQDVNSIIHKYEQELAHIRTLDTSLSQQLEAARSPRPTNINVQLRSEVETICSSHSPLSIRVRTIKDIRSITECTDPVQHHRKPHFPPV